MVVVESIEVESSSSSSSPGSLLTAIWVSLWNTYLSNYQTYDSGQKPSPLLDQHEDGVQWHLLIY